MLSMVCSVAGLLQLLLLLLLLLPADATSVEVEGGDLTRLAAMRERRSGHSCTTQAVALPGTRV